MGSKQCPVIFSACLLGIKCRYDGKGALNTMALEEYSSRCLLPLCPEQLGGLPTPRPKAEIEGGDGSDVINGRASVRDVRGRDITKNFLKGAREVLKIARFFGIKEAILRDKSPSCGVRFIYKRRRLVKGMGTAAALLKKEGLDIRGIS